MLKCRNVPEYDMLPTAWDYCTDTSSSCWPSNRWTEASTVSWSTSDSAGVFLRTWMSSVSSFRSFGWAVLVFWAKDVSCWGDCSTLCAGGGANTHTHTHTCFTIFVRTFSGINAFLSLLCSCLITHKGCFFFLLLRRQALVCTKSGCIQRKTCCRSLKVAATAQLVTEIWTQALFFLLL